MKAIRFHTAVINNSIDSWNARCALPEIGLLPIVRKTFRLEEEDISRQMSLTVRHERCQLAEARARTRAMRMNQHNQCRAIRRTLNPALNRPTLGRRSGYAWSVL